MKTAAELKGEGFTLEEIAEQLQLPVTEVEKQLELPRITPEQRIEAWRALQRKPWMMSVAVAFAFGVLGGGALGVMRFDDAASDGKSVIVDAEGRAAAVLSFQSSGKLTIKVNSVEVGEANHASGVTDVLIPPELLYGNTRRIAFEGPGRFWNVRIEQFAVPLPYSDEALGSARELMLEGLEGVDPLTRWRIYRKAWVTLQRARIQPFAEELQARARFAAAREELDAWCRQEHLTYDECPSGG